MVKSIVAATGVKIDIEDDGRIHISSADQKAAAEAIRMINEIIAEAEIGKVYHGVVKKIMDFGAFVEILPGTDGLVHISELAHERVKAVTDVLKEGDELDVKVLDVDRQGKIRLSRRVLLPVPEGMTMREPDTRPDRPDRDRRPEAVHHESVLTNGLRVLSEELPYFRSVAVGVWLNVGSRDEGRDENGLSHFLEHLAFKGTPRRTALEIAREIDQIGALATPSPAKSKPASTARCWPSICPGSLICWATWCFTPSASPRT